MTSTSIERLAPGAESKRFRDHRCTVQLFGLHAQVPLIDAFAESATEAERTVLAPSLHGYALIEAPAAGRYPDYPRREEMEWRIDVPRNGPFAVSDTVANDAARTRIPVSIALRLQEDLEVTAWRKSAAVEARDPVQSYGRLTLREGRSSPAPGGQHNSAERAGAAESRPAAVDADELELLTLVLPRSSFNELIAAIRRGEDQAIWAGTLRLQPELNALVVTGHDWLALATQGGRRSSALRLEWEEAMGWRAARSTWAPHLPDVRLWRDSEVHVALRESIPVLARQGARENWTDERRTEVFTAVLSHVMDWRLESEYILHMLRGQIGDDPPECWTADQGAAQVELGCRGIDPYSYHVLNGPAAADLESLAEACWQGSGEGSDLLARRIVHALLTAETGGYLRDQELIAAGSTGAERHLLAVQFGPKRPAYNGASGIAQWQHKRVKQMRKFVMQSLALALVCTFVGIVAGFWIAGVAGALVGLLLGGWLGSRTFDRRSRELEQSNRLSEKMQRAVAVASYDNNPWSEIVASMRAAARLGAAWPAVAWSIAEAAVRHEPRPPDLA